MYVIKGENDYKATKVWLKHFIGFVRDNRKKYQNNVSDFLNAGFIIQIKEFVKQLRIYRRKNRGII